MPWLLCSALLLAGSCLAAPLLLDGVAAHVNEEILTISDVMAVVQQRMPAGRNLPPDEQDRRLRSAYDEALNELINQRLILQAYDVGKMKLPDWVIDKRVEEIIEDRFSGDRSLLLTALSRDRMTYDDWKQRIRDGIVLAAMRSSHVERNVSISPEAVKAYYDTHSEEMSQAAAIHVELIVLRPEADDTDRSRVRAMGEKVVAFLAAGEAFADVARRHSAGARAAQGGDWGWVEPDEYFREEIVTALAALKPGETSGLIETPEELYIVRKAEVRAPGIKPLAEARDEIEARLRRQHAERLYREWVARLRADAYLKVFDLPDRDITPSE